ncbi:MAG: SRPBCC family protein [Ktedonobacteraceae bacterium]|nr:SRPBCC family protein [Ktedonobacteraceae bacterium]
MFIHAHQVIVIHCTGAAVFALISDATKEPQWNPAVLKTERLSEQPNGIGAVYQETHRVIFRQNIMTFEVVSYQPDAQFGTKTLSGGPLQISQYTLNPHPDGVQVVLSVDIQIPGLLRFLAPLLRRIAGEETLKSLTRLKLFLENEPTNASLPM